jgi:predicted MFS family arabinose efflux permease
MSRAASQVGGPGIGGGLIELITAPVAILADSLSYLGSALFVLLIRRQEPRVDVPEGGHPRMRRQIAEGWAFVVGHPYLRWIAMCTATSNLFGSMLQAVFLVYAVRVLGLSPGLIGLIFTVGGIGAIVGALVAGPAARVLRLGWAIVMGIVLADVAWVAVPLAPKSNPLPLLVAVIGFGGIGNVVYNVNQVSYRQAICPPGMQGRMNATMRFLVWGTLPVGAFIGGVLGNAVGLRPTLWIGAIGGLTAILPVLVTRVRTLDRIPEPSPDDLAGAVSRTDAGAIEPGHIPHAPMAGETTSERPR